MPGECGSKGGALRAGSMDSGAVNGGHSAGAALGSTGDAATNLSASAGTEGEMTAATGNGAGSASSTSTISSSSVGGTNPSSRSRTSSRRASATCSQVAAEILFAFLSRSSCRRVAASSSLSVAWCAVLIVKPHLRQRIWPGLSLLAQAGQRSREAGSRDLPKMAAPASHSPCPTIATTTRTATSPISPQSTPIRAPDYSKGRKMPPTAARNR